MPESATVVGPVGRSVSSRRGVLAGGSGEVERGWPLRLGVLTAQVGPALVDEVVAAAGAGAAVAGPRGGLLRARVVPVQRRGRGSLAGLPIGGAVADQRAAAVAERAEGAVQPGVESGPAAAGRRTA